MCGYASAIYKNAVLFYPCTLALSAAATFTNIKIRYNAKTPQIVYLGHGSYVCSTVDGWLKSYVCVFVCVCSGRLKKDNRLHSGLTSLVFMCIHISKYTNFPYKR